MRCKPYPTDLTDGQWERIAPLLPVPKSGTKKGGRPAADTREVLDAIFYLLRGGQAWRALPRDFPPWKTVYTRLRLWQLAGAWEQIHAAFREEIRVEAGHPPTPATLRVDSQAVKTAHRGGPRGFDGGKKVNGRERFVAVDSLGLLWALSVLTADVQDRDGGCRLLEAARRWLPRVREAIADSGFSERFVEFVRRVCRRKVTITAKAADGFKVQPRRWVVGRTFAWLVHYRRLMVDYEFATETSEAMIQAAMTHLMVRRLRPAR